MTTHTIRQATIFISQSNGTKVYSSFDDIPVRLRRQLLESTTGPASATIVIADRAGRAEIVRSLRHRGSDGGDNATRGAAPALATRYPWTEAFARRSCENDAPGCLPRAGGFPWRDLPWAGIGLWTSAAAALAWLCLRP